jgi:hypothetical protein
MRSSGRFYEVAHQDNLRRISYHSHYDPQELVVYVPRVTE